MDLSLVKRVTLGQTRYADLRLEAFNLFDRTNYMDPNGTWGSANFGVISNAFEKRVVQAAVRFAF